MSAHCIDPRSPTSRTSIVGATSTSFSRIPSKFSRSATYRKTITQLWMNLYWTMPMAPPLTLRAPKTSYYSQLKHPLLQYPKSRGKTRYSYCMYKTLTPLRVCMRLSPIGNLKIRVFEWDPTWPIASQSQATRHTHRRRPTYKPTIVD